MQKRDTERERERERERETGGDRPVVVTNVYREQHHVEFQHLDLEHAHVYQYQCRDGERERDCIMCDVFNAC